LPSFREHRHRDGRDRLAHDAIQNISSVFIIRPDSKSLWRRAARCRTLLLVATIETAPEISLLGDKLLKSFGDGGKLVRRRHAAGKKQNGGQRGRIRQASGFALQPG